MGQQTHWDQGSKSERGFRPVKTPSTAPLPTCNMEGLLCAHPRAHRVAEWIQKSLPESPQCGSQSTLTRHLALASMADNAPHNVEQKSCAKTVFKVSSSMRGHCESSDWVTWKFSGDKRRVPFRSLGREVSETVLGWRGRERAALWGWV